MAYRQHTNKKVKAAVRARDGGRCRVCGSNLYLEFDHITPASVGGRSTVDNLQQLCRKCNLKKRNKVPCRNCGRLLMPTATHCLSCDAAQPAYRSRANRGGVDRRWRWLIFLLFVLALWIASKLGFHFNLP